MWVIADPKVEELPYSKGMCLWVIEVYYGYLHLSLMFKFFLSFTQFDFVLVTAVSDMVTKVWTYEPYVRHKRYLPVKRGGELEVEGDEMLDFVTS
jgi:hypothetical protein